MFVRYRVTHSDGISGNFLGSAIFGGILCVCVFFLGCFFVFQPSFVAFVASVAFVGVWLLWLYHALPIYLSIYLT